jgi:hypothetical protein
MHSGTGGEGQGQTKSVENVTPCRPMRSAAAGKNANMGAHRLTKCLI